MIEIFRAQGWKAHGKLEKREIQSEENIVVLLEYPKRLSQNNGPKTGYGKY